jgi:hypothetical protein
MKKMTFAVLVLSLICFSVIIGCKKTETEQPAPAQTEQAQPAPAADQAPAAPADKK